MASIPKKVSDKFQKRVGKFQRILKKASDSDLNEADTVTIVNDILCEVFGFDKYLEITSEYAIRGTYCDLAVKVEDNVKYLIEVKSISLDLKESHLRQAVDYGAHEGIQWVVLTNGLIWQVYSIVLKKTVEYEKVFEIDFLRLNPRKTQDHELLFLLAKEGLRKDVISEYHERIQSVNKNVISAILLSEPILNLLKRELRRMNPGIRVDAAEIEAILRNDVIKRNILDVDGFTDAMRRVKRVRSKIAKTKNDGVPA
jgi:hypothetical protein